MAPHTFIFTNSPYKLNQISLASFVPNLQQPHQDAERTYQVQEPDYDIQDDESFDVVLNSSSESHLKAAATKFASIFGNKDKSDQFQVQASKGRIYSLKQPDALFRKLVSGDDGIAETQRWLEDCKMRGLTPRFVVAFRTLVDARLAASEREGIAFGGKITAPVGEALGGDPTGMADIMGEASHESRKEAQGGMKTPGERIYAIGYRKVKLTYRRGKVMASLPSLENTWESFASPRGDMEADDGVGEEDEDSDVYVKADLLEGDDDKDCRVYSVPKLDGETEAFGILIDDKAW
ncbi:hypothetical protein C8A01DRAFT_51131 [Parachaetomium inaequale]|uniref:Uncharacterized protein n=1 Tax=Parachaetomium inaequale TaxID=2588326 RepID=A0AAN6P554_9PEZI|nr:hypothetical protein C8A01DRAFT_51131 [Parachaetomium inaequale]